MSAVPVEMQHRAHLPGEVRNPSAVRPSAGATLPPSRVSSIADWLIGRPSRSKSHSGCSLTRRADTDVHDPHVQRDGPGDRTRPQHRPGLLTSIHHREVLHIAMQRPVAGVAARQRQRQRQPAFGVGVHGPGVSDRAERIGPPTPDRRTLLDQVGVHPVRDVLEVLEKLPQRLRHLTDVVDAHLKGLLNEFASLPGAEFTVIGLGHEPLRDRVPFGEATDERRGDVIGGERSTPLSRNTRSRIRACPVPVRASGYLKAAGTAATPQKPPGAHHQRDSRKHGSQFGP